MSPPIVFTRDMGLDHAEFFRVLGRALGEDHPSGEEIVIDLGEGRNLTITLAPTRRRRIAGIVLPATVVRFAYDGLTPVEAEADMARWDRIFQRGGG